jgi:UDP-glucose 4-epimerase
METKKDNYNYIKKNIPCDIYDKNNQSYILVTGGTGFIGSHFVVKAILAGHSVIILDNLCNSNLNVITKIENTLHKENLKDYTEDSKRLIFIYGDIRDNAMLHTIFGTYNITSVIHFAALKSVSESQKNPDLYHDVNVFGTINLLNVMNCYNCRNFIYSSSATVYGDAKPPVTEDSPTGIGLACNYAQNKYNVESYLIDKIQNSDEYDGLSVVILRYFNPIGAHPSGLLGESPNDIPNNIFPYLLRVALYHNSELYDDTYFVCDERYKQFTIFGSDYETPDGTCIRDYVHVQDLARAHIEILNTMNNSKTPIRIYNVGTGVGTSVKEIVTIFNKVLIEKNMLPIPYVFGARREGDLSVSCANVNKIFNEVGFFTTNNIHDMCRDGINYIFSFDKLH